MPRRTSSEVFRECRFLFQYGLYASIVPGFLYTVFGTIKEVTIGPTAVNALISYNYAGPSAARALTLAFWTGLIQISLAFFQMGKCDSTMESGRSESDMYVCLLCKS